MPGYRCRLTSVLRRYGEPIEVVIAAKRPDFDRRKAPTRFELVYEALQASA
jgi:hypothetical protein